MALKTITPQEAKKLMDDGAKLVDIREKDEHAREKIPQSINVAVSRLNEEKIIPNEKNIIIFHCRSGMRTMQNASKLKDSVGDACEAYIVEGGIDAWKKAGLPVDLNKSQPIDLMRQVQIGAGTLALAGSALAFIVDPAFLAIPAFVGAGLLLAGTTGFCGMARILIHMPWNASLKN